MKLWSRIILGGLTLALALSLNVVTASAATSSKKKSSTKKEAKKKEEKKKEAKKEARHSSGEPNQFISGTNISGRSGLLFGDTSDVAGIGKVEGSAHIIYQSLASFTVLTYTTSSNLLSIPFGGHFGVAKNLELSAGANLQVTSFSSNFPGAVSASTSNFSIMAGGKYRIAGTSSNSPDFSLGGEITIPTSGGQVVVTPRGTVTYELKSGLLLNGDLGVNISTVTYVSFDAGVGIPFGDKFSGIVEWNGGTLGGTLTSTLAGGARVNLNGLKLQALLGLPLNGGGVQIGAGLILASK